MAAQSSKVIKVSVISDITCPWCYIGLKELDMALERVKIPEGRDIKFEIQHMPFLLNPTLPVDEVQKKMDYVAERIGMQRWNQARTLMAERCKQLGMKPFQCDGYVFSTWRAHRLLTYAWNKGGAEVQHKLLYRLYEGAFYHAEKLNDVEVLAQHAVDIGLMSKDEAVKFLKSDALHAEVQSMVTLAQRNGVSGVPFTLIDKRWAISGGQTADVYYNIFQKLANGEEP
ncbi:hypothetical protein M422DRAFT_46351 [Sphaerobolus stellatus SS14]|uniref:DSBA-like thioredoxin domain-containing protein n=1 Tax=Sphaerobolus stellatus (strain SS14) TaxID=990650 RepID=A0A0C9W2Y7_SPHS4|nr:hypothetical protein M422DRAFT_46351 [Sphaerobolus stellatus SS14]